MFSSDGLLKLFVFDVMNWRRFSEARSPIMMDEEFLYGMITVGEGSLLRCAFGEYGSRGFLSIPACRKLRTLNASCFLERSKVGIQSERR